MKPVFLELFSGTASMSAAFKRHGWDVVTVDNDPKHNPDFCMNVLDITPEWIAEINPTFIWAGIDCSCFSVMTISRYWTEDKQPKEENWGMPLLMHTLYLIRESGVQFWCIENPRAMMRTLPQMKTMDRATVWYCQYGGPWAKPTDLFGPLPSGFFAQQCKNSNPNCHHEKAPRGTTSGVQSGKNKTERSKYPEELCRQIAHHSTEDYLCSRGQSRLSDWF